MKKQVKVLIGNFGSGKTELALNFAVQAAKRKKTLLVDLDIINPYFRSAERKDVLNAAGVKLLHPNFAMTGIDVPSLPPDIYSAFVDDHELVVFDVGGDPAGAAALGQYRQNFMALDKGCVEVLFVVNPRRPLASNMEELTALYERIQLRSRLAITGLVNNANLSTEASAEDLLSGYPMVRELSKTFGVPVAYTTGTEPVLNGFQKIMQREALDKDYVGTLFAIQTYMHRDWDTFTQKGI